jgi:chorismate synthase
MSANIFGERLRYISFGESHGPGYGIVLEGFPANIAINEKLLQFNLDKRRPGATKFVSARSELDNYEILSGVFESKTLGTPIAVTVRNQNQKSEDYNKIKKQPRIGHADDTWKSKFIHSDYRGGGRSSGRETLNRVIAGSFAQMLMNKVSPKTKVEVFATQIGPKKIKPAKILSLQTIKFLETAKTNGESYGGVIECKIKSPPRNLGQPIFHKLKADLALATMSLGATTGFELGGGFESVGLKGTKFHQKMVSKNYGGIRGGITTGEDIIFRVAFKPTSSIKDIAKKGRHDPCIVPRAMPVIESIAWFALADHWLWSQTDALS